MPLTPNFVKKSQLDPLFFYTSQFDFYFENFDAIRNPFVLTTFNRCHLSVCRDVKKIRTREYLQIKLIMGRI